jgi:hypothetical protein
LFFGLRATTTLAVGSVRASANGESLPGVMCTRALSTGSKCRMVFASSSSSAMRSVVCSIDCVMPKGVFSSRA